MDHVIIDRFISPMSSIYMDRVELRNMDIEMPGYHINQTTWYFRIGKANFLDFSSHAEFYVDANTGEVLYVSADIGYDIPESRKPITAKEGKPMADEVINKIDSNAVLYQISAGFFKAEENLGKYPIWKYKYLSYKWRKVIEVGVNSQGNTGWSYNDWPFYNMTDAEPVEIHDWPIDSEDAYSISLTNATVQSFYDNYGDYDDFTMVMYLRTSHIYWGMENVTAWKIELLANKLSNNEYRMDVYVDAQSGEVIYIRDWNELWDRFGRYP